ncbi:branched-chain amino acid ABC transporter permease [Nocardioides sp. W3-2-3]|nr:branched-chain amino acid ABC transporter permease [Nocardioides convexus]
MGSLFAFTLLGLFTGAAYAIMASGLVLTYTTTRVFNIAHGAFGMVLAFTFWDFTQRQGLPTLLSLFLVLGVVAPAIGWFIQRFVTRGLGEGPVSVALVVTVGLLVGLIGLAQQIWKPEARVLLPFYADTGWRLGDTYITAHQVVTIVCSIVVAIGLYLLLNRTRIGVAMRASVDNPDLLRLFGGKPDTVAALAWAIGMSLAALGGILLTPVVGLDYYALTLLVINAYAAAMLGRLKSLPLTFAGAMGLGILESLAVAYLPTQGFWSTVRPVIPALFLFAIVVMMPQAQPAHRPGQGHRRGPGAARAQGGRLRRRTARRGLRADRPGLPGRRAADRRRGDVRDGDALPGPADRVRRPRLPRAVHLRRGGRAGLRQTRRAQPARAGAGGADRRGGRRPGGAARAAADRALPRPVDARLRRADGQDDLPGGVRLQVQRDAGDRAGLGARRADRQ